MKQQLVSVIITTFKRPNLLSRAIDSVFDQTYKNYEIIVVDDNDPRSIEKNQTQQILSYPKYSSIKYIDLNGNFGYAKARNIGIQNSKGTYIAFLDDDDAWLPEKLEKQVTRIETDELIGLVYCSGFNVKNNGEIYKIDISRKPSGYIFKELLMEDSIGATSKVLVRKNCINSIGLLDESTPTRADHDWFLRLAKEYKISWINEPLIYFFIDQERLSRNVAKKIAGWEFFLKRWETELAKYPNALNNQKFNYYYQIGKILFLQNQNKQALNYFKSALKLKPSFWKIYIFIILAILNFPARVLNLR